MAQAELDGIGSSGGGKFVHKRFNSEAGLRTFGIAQVRGAQWRARSVEAGENMGDGMDVRKNVCRRLHAPLREFIHAAGIGNSGELLAAIIIRGGGHEN